jgi:hypothetical protein
MFRAKEVLKRSQLNKQANGTVTVTISNPLKKNYVNGPDAVTDTQPDFKLTGDPAGLTGDDCVLSITPSGEWQVRKAGTTGPWESGIDKDGFVTFHADGNHAFQIAVES